LELILTRIWRWFAALLLLAAACADPANKEAKQRIFSPEDPPKVISSAAEKLDPSKLDSDSQLVRRVLRMGGAEVTERLGPHKFSANIRLEWAGAGKIEELVEKRNLLAGPGGVAGDFHATVENSRDQGLEVIRAEKVVYARNRYGRFRQRLRDRGMAEREREEIYGAIRDFDALFAGRLKLTAQGNGTFQGRPAYRYAAALDPAAPPTPAADNDLPPLLTPKGGRDPASEHRLMFFEKRRPQSIQGELWVDAQSAAMLSAKLEGKLSAPSPSDPKEVSVRLTLSTTVTGIGKDPKVKAPNDFLPDADKPHGIAAALDRFGIPHGPGAKDAGTEPTESDEEP
jgi:hypothetical protein